MTLNFYLDKPKLEGDTAIYLFLRVGNGTLSFRPASISIPSTGKQEQIRTATTLSAPIPDTSSLTAG
ncbi:hypothetical protein [Pontibacter pamirensis]|uniref:hypothetical protein n=1 Tax=Pontibacter pamirensis TaxID=2562824 RepID=UPI001389A6F8|nr:hypothetical protein [Pontibacter pamirensis]